MEATDAFEKWGLLYFANLPKRLIVLIDDAIKDALIDKYEWNVKDNVAFGKLKEPDAK
ncbi:hypothetical protein MIZ01_1581 [Sideroxyarcus emersonii]|uniref:Uncharacterized protein n=1 Tax=Sideroxyarcus emersonii TaxID=2764705 RepID=A0AAN1XA72_9PROT|nr:hypothetical protein [Sideroxyarcus emersonii]BCK87785.1 hypothetical protein MIZ01_1581 [Sideroxyarcus emersonii]